MDLGDRTRREEFLRGLRWLERAISTRAAKCRFRWRTTFVLADAEWTSEHEPPDRSDETRDVLTYPALASCLRFV